MAWRLHHGSQKIKSEEDRSCIDIVVTTYNTVAAEWKKHARNASYVFTMRWRRVVLDEGMLPTEVLRLVLTASAHDIRDHRRPTCKAICALEATSRWAITGTPIQNRLLDIASLFQFLRVPSCETPTSFQALVNRLTTKFGQHSATSRLRHLVQCIMLRRSTGTVLLPERDDLVCRLDFTGEERGLYDHLRCRSLQSNMGKKPESSSGAQHSILETINQLRWICNLGIFMKDREQARGELNNAWTPEAAQEIFNSLVVANSAACKLCNTDLGSAATEVADHA